MGRECLLVTTAKATRRMPGLSLNKQGLKMARMRFLSRWALEWTGLALAAHLQFTLT